LIWRGENSIDKIFEEDFYYYEDQFPFYFDGVDFEGRPGKIS